MLTVGAMLSVLLATSLPIETSTPILQLAMLTGSLKLHSQVSLFIHGFPSSAHNIEGDERNNMSTLADVASWNRRNNATTGALGNSTYWLVKSF